MKRRDFVALLSGGSFAWPLAARGQSMPVIGFLSGGLASAATVPVAGFRQGLRQTGYVEGQNLQIAFRGGRTLRAISRIGSRIGES